jgi:hypothetical protein
MSYDPGAPGDRSQPPGYGGPGPGGPPPYGSGGYGQQPPPGWGPQPGGPGGPGGFGGGPGGPPGYGGNQLQSEGRNFFAALFDYTFSSFATYGLIRVLYIIGTVIIGLAWLGMTITYFSLLGALPGLLVLIFGAIVALFYLAFMRVMLEFFYAVVRMSDDIHNRR